MLLVVAAWVLLAHGPHAVVAGGMQSPAMTAQAQMLQEAPTPSRTPADTLSGDVDGDCDVDVVDIQLVASRWRAKQGDPSYDARYDLDADGDIDVLDIMIVAGHWGETCPPTPTPTATPTITATPLPTLTPSASPTATTTPTSTSTPTGTLTPSVTATGTASPTPTNTTTATASSSPTRTATATQTATTTGTPTHTATATATLTPPSVPVSTTLTIEIPSSGVDGLRNWGYLRLPAGYQPDQPVPLVVALHSWNGSAQETLFNNGGRGHFYSFAVTERGWLLLAPDLSRGDLPWHVAVLGVQHRLIELVNKVRSEYAADGSRIYIIGISGGGHRAVLMAEKYPDVFAAAVDVKGPTKLVDWFWDDQSGDSDICDGNHRSSLCDDTYGPPVGVTGGPPYERYSCLFSGRDGLVRNLRHVPVAILHNTGYDPDPDPPHNLDYSIVPIDHARDLKGAIESWNPDRLPFYREFPGGHSANPSPVQQAELMDWLAAQRFDISTAPQSLDIKTDESKSYYWLTVQQENRLDSLHHDPWTAVSAEYDLADGSIVATVTDTQGVTVTFNLAWMGLDMVNDWVVEERELPSGQLEVSFLQPMNGLLTVSVGGSDQYHLYMYPQTANRQVRILELVWDTYLDAWEPSRKRFQASTLWLRKDGVYSPLLKFSLGDIPTGARILSAVLRLYVSAARDNPPLDLNVWVYRVNRAWVHSEATYEQARSGVNWTTAGCNGSPSDREALACASLAIPDGGKWLSFDVTAVVQDWVDALASNEGWILKCDNYLGIGYYELASQEFPDVSKRPELVVIYEP